MTKDELQHLYKEKILPENREPYHFSRPAEVAQSVLAYNPVCGDKFELLLTGNDLSELYFHGFGCAISKASTSIMLRLLERKSIEEARELCTDFLAAFAEGTPESLPLNDQEEALKILVELKNFDGRVDCITLSWQAMADYLNKTHPV